MTWKQMLIEMVQGIESDNVSGWFMLGILYMVVAFGIFGTMLMMTMERKKEFAVMVSIGMHRFKLSRILTVETIFIAIIGVIAGIIASTPIIYYYNQFPIQLTGEAAKAMMDFNVEPIMPFALNSHIFIQQTIIILILTLIAALYPITYVHRFNVLRAFRGK
jgi:ABC-type antimicrobial peptide transport system permease subunit